MMWRQVNTHDHPILIAYDGSAGSRHAIDATADLFPGKAAIVLHAWSPVAIIAAACGSPVSLSTYHDDELQHAATRISEEGCRLAIAAGLHARPEIAEVAFQGTAHTILDVADEYDADLVVLGARGLSTFKSLLLGSVSRDVAQHAHRPVLIIPAGIDVVNGANAVAPDAATV
jgi:nucleotide-binding universal stress UspA family protein